MRLHIWPLLSWMMDHSTEHVRKSTGPSIGSSTGTTCPVPWGGRTSNPFVRGNKQKQNTVAMASLKRSICDPTYFSRIHQLNRIFYMYKTDCFFFFIHFHLQPTHHRKKKRFPLHPPTPPPMLPNNHHQPSRLSSTHPYTPL